MNSVNIRKKMQSMIPQTDEAKRFCSRYGNVYDNIIEVIISYYYAVPSFDGPHAIEVFDRFVKTGVLDFRQEATK